jgi:lipoprotein-anchoring transpeptidase ErfK/SrfK
MLPLALWGLLLIATPVTVRADRKSAPRQKSSALPIQVALDRAGFSPGEIDGVAGANTSRALTAFQASRSLEATGVADAATRAKLREVMGSALRSYTITAEDAAGPFNPDIPEDTMAKASLPALGYRSIVELLGERFHVDPELLRRLNPRAQFRAGRRIRVPDTGTGSSSAPAATLRVSKSGSVAEAFDADGRLVFFAPISAGSERDPLPIGEWKVTAIVENPTFSYDPELFWDADPSHAKAKLAAGPNNPVGTVWIDLDKDHYGLHGTDQPSKVGHQQSHGCVRLTNWDALRLARLLRVGTPVLFVD